MTLLVFALIRAPLIGWGSVQTILELAGAGALLAAFTANEIRHRHPLFPFSIFRVKGLVAADITQLVAFAGFLTMFFFVTLYMQDVLRFSPIQAGVAYLPVTAAFGISAGIGTQLITRIGTRPVIVGGALIAAAGIYWLSRVPVHGTYAANVLPGLLTMPLGAGAVFVGVTIAANVGVPAHQAGFAAALLNAARQVGSALGLAIFSAIATSRTHHLLATHTPKADRPDLRLPARATRLQHLRAGRRAHRPALQRHPRSRHDPSNPVGTRHRPRHPMSHTADRYPGQNRQPHHSCRLQIENDVVAGL